MLSQQFVVQLLLELPLWDQWGGWNRDFTDSQQSTYAIPLPHWNQFGAKCLKEHDDGIVVGHHSLRVALVDGAGIVGVGQLRPALVSHDGSHCVRAVQ